MKRIKSMELWSVILTVLLFGGVMGCQNDSGLNNKFDLRDFESGEFAIFSFDDALDGIESASLEKSMTMNPDLFNGNHFRQGGPFGRGGPRGPHGPRTLRGKSGNHLGKILRELNLTEEQKLQLRELMSGHRECIQEPLAAFRDANKDIIDAANEQRRAILEALRNGEIDNNQAREQVDALNESTREAIQNNPESQAPREALCACKLALFENVGAILTEDQQNKFDDWVAGLSGVCFEG